MSRISMVIADSDEGYVDSLADFIMNKHSGRFQVYAFTKRENLLNFLSQKGKTIDILFTTKMFHTEDKCLDKVKTIIYMSERNLHERTNGFSQVYKYQKGDSLVSHILKVFAESNKNELLLTNMGKRTLLAAVYSPAGGVGKTTIAMACSILCAREDLSVFYLNFEDIPSNAPFCESPSETTLSNVIFEIQERTTNIALKLEGIKSIDNQYGISYFNSPESIRELDSIEGEDIKFFIDQFISAGQYDVIFADMSTSFNCRNRALLEGCDMIILVLSQDEYCLCKTRALMRELDIITQKEDSTIQDKINFIINKYRKHISFDSNLSGFSPKGVSVQLPFVEELEKCNNIEDTVNTGCGFGTRLKEFLQSSGILT